MDGAYFLLQRFGALELFAFPRKRVFGADLISLRRLERVQLRLHLVPILGGCLDVLLRPGDFLLQLRDGFAEGGINLVLAVQLRIVRKLRTECRAALDGGLDCGAVFFFLREGALQRRQLRLLNGQLGLRLFERLLGLLLRSGKREAFVDLRKLCFQRFAARCGLLVPLRVPGDERIQKRHDLVHGKGAVLCLLYLQGEHIVLPDHDTRAVLPDAGFGLFILLAEAPGLVLEPHLKGIEVFRVEELLEDLFPLVGGGLEELSEVPLGQHGDLTELAAVHAQDLRDGLVDLPRPGDEAAVGVSQLRVGLLLGKALAAGLAAGVLGIAPDGVAPARVVEDELDLGGCLGRGILGAEHTRVAVVAAGFAEEGEGDGVKDRGLARAGVSG